MNSSRSIKFKVEHISRFSYQQTARSSTMSVRLHPRQDKGQCVQDFFLQTDPVSSCVSFVDSFGNICHLLDIAQCHDELVVQSSAELELVVQPAFRSDPEFDTWDMLATEVNLVWHWDYLGESKYVRQSSTLEKFMNSCGIQKGVGPVSSMIEAAYSLFHHFSYERGSTDVNSSAEAILQTRRGVCQDYTHVLLAIGRHWGIPSRYVSGYLRLDGSDDFQTPVGESHCWVEFLQPRRGWIGIDPTNNTLADDRYVRVAVGRDYADVPPTKGIVFGAGQSSVDVQVVVEQKSTNFPYQVEQ